MKKILVAVPLAVVALAFAGCKDPARHRRHVTAVRARQVAPHPAPRQVAPHPASRKAPPPPAAPAHQKKGAPSPAVRPPAPVR